MLILAIPKGRILKEVAPLFALAGIVPEKSFYDESSRALRFKTNDTAIDLIRVRAFDVAAFVAYGGAQVGIAGSDVLDEYDSSDIYAPVDLNIGHCRLSVAAPVGAVRGYASPIRVATKYPKLTAAHFAARGIQAECIKLNGAMEIAPALGLCSHIVDLVSTGRTLAENGLQEVEKIMDVSSRLIVSRAAFKNNPQGINALIARFQKNAA